MKTVGERIRRVREARGLSGEELAHQVGYKHQSGISNLENRATGHGGYKLPLIAKALNVDVGWLLAGPDDLATKDLPPYREPQQSAPVAQEDSAPYFVPANDEKHELRASVHRLIEKTSDVGLAAMLTMITAIAAAHPRTTEDGAGLRFPARGASG